MTVVTAHLLLDQIDAAIKADQGAAYRTKLGEIILHFHDAFRGQEEGFRSHMGASIIGLKCPREVWYKFRWVSKGRHEGRIIRLFNSGHLFEPKIVAMLLACGIQVFQQDANGEQYKVSDCDGHFGGSGDGVLFGVPDVPSDTWCLLEAKTHNDKSFKDVEKHGVRVSKPEHFAQIQVYLLKMGLSVCLYVAANKNDDSLYLELVHVESHIGEQLIDRAKTIIYMQHAPDPISNTPGWHECSFCDYKTICHLKDYPDSNCRTCYYSRPVQDGKWFCDKVGRQQYLTKEMQLSGCEEYVVNQSFE